MRNADFYGGMNAMVSDGKAGLLGMAMDAGLASQWL